MNNNEKYEQTLAALKTAYILNYDVEGNVLDLGCGDGTIAEGLMSDPSLFGRTKRYVGIDINEVAIEKVKSRKIPNTRWLAMDALEFMKTTKMKFQTVLALNFIEHIEDAPEMLQAIRSIMHPGGQIIITVPNALSLHKRIRQMVDHEYSIGELTEYDKKIGHHQSFTHMSLAMELMLSGFIPSRFTGIVLKPFTSEQMAGLDQDMLSAFVSLGTQFFDLCGTILMIAQPIPENA